MGTRSNRLGEAVLTSTHNLCFGAKIRKIGIPLYTPVLLYKVGFKGVFIARTCYPDEIFFYDVSDSLFLTECPDREGI